MIQNLRRNHVRLSTSIDTPSSPWRWITHAAFVLIGAIVIARLTTTEVLRDPWVITPGTPAISRGAGAASGAVLDLLSLLPAILILFRAAIDPTFRLIWRWSYAPMFLLGMLAIASAAWSADKFIAAVTAAHLFAGFCLLWSASQAVRTWDKLRLVAAICFGLLLVLVAQSVIYSTIDVAENTRYWNENKSRILKEHNWEPGSFSATQFEHKIVSGEVPSFFTSANTFAAVGVMLAAVSVGIGIQRIISGDGRSWLALSIAAAGGAVWIIFVARSKTAGATPILGVGLFLIIRALRSQLQRHARRFYWLGVSACFGVIAAIVGHGLYHHGLFPGHFSNSLDFRWKYWFASAHILPLHPFLGVGWSNFGAHYLGVRLPEASEEIKDPHNFLVRFFIELGAVGGLLLIGWLLRLWWEMTRPSESTPASIEDEKPDTIVTAALICVMGMLLSILVNVDFSQSAADITLELLRRILYLLALLLGTISGCMISPHHRKVDARPAAWLFYCLLIAVGLFLIHNLIDFSLFEVGPMFVFLLLAGSALGMAPAKPHGAKRRSIAIAGAIVALAVWAAAAVGFVAPVIAAEQSAFDANEEVRAAPDDSQAAAIHYARAADHLKDSLDAIPYNADYMIRRARDLIGAGRTAEAEEAISAAIRLNPMMIEAYLMQANVQMRKASPDVSVIHFDYDAILRLNPNDVYLRQQYAQALDRLGQRADARRQYELALKYNDLLPPGEPKRLSAEDIAEIQRQIRDGS